MKYGKSRKSRKEVGERVECSLDNQDLKYQRQSQKKEGHYIEKTVRPEGPAPPKFFLKPKERICPTKYLAM